ncbi:hypothetical protein M7I_5121 [Glarea lozoyensis 74030]|uniref:Uncharacterized protein n=1 Tax=Glarea lozoyensis (strain ATCC 74030 / MF5533) TaxID=1104152 RepID=H0ER10_GLAL7|nr:hypothetical protein M7I_5121 [Glarea lozoyensis 74030]
MMVAVAYMDPQHGGTPGCPRISQLTFMSRYTNKREILPHRIIHTPHSVHKAPEALAKKWKAFYARYLARGGQYMWQTLLLLNSSE